MHAVHAMVITGSKLISAVLQVVVHIPEADMADLSTAWGEIEMGRHQLKKC